MKLIEMKTVTKARRKLYRCVLQSNECSLPTHIYLVYSGGYANHRSSFFKYLPAHQWRIWGFYLKVAYLSLNYYDPSSLRKCCPGERKLDLALGDPCFISDFSFILCMMSSYLTLLILLSSLRHGDNNKNKGRQMF